MFSGRQICSFCSLPQHLYSPLYWQNCLHDQIYANTGGILSKTQCGFRKRYSTQYSIIAMIAKWRRNLDQGGICRALISDLIKAFDGPVYDFLLAKLEAYGFIYKSLKLINSYPTDKLFI